MNTTFFSNERSHFSFHSLTNTIVKLYTNKYTKVASLVKKDLILHLLMILCIHRNIFKTPYIVEQFIYESSLINTFEQELNEREKKKDNNKVFILLSI